MDTRLLRFYEEELRFIREMGGEFAREYPKIAGRLGLDSFECADPYVERLLEGVAFLTARIQLKLDAEFPDFTRHLLEIVHPHLVCPVPSMAVVEFEPDLDEGGLSEGVPVPRGSVLRSVLAKGEKTACEYRTAHPVTLWPLRIVDARYLSNAGTIAAGGLPVKRNACAALQISLEVTAGLRLADLALGCLPVFLRGSDETPMRLYEQIHGNCIGVSLRCEERVQEAPICLPPDRVRQLGFEVDEALLPPTRRSFEGYRLLQEYFAIPQRFMFFELAGLAPSVPRLNGHCLEVTLFFDRVDNRLEHTVQPDRFALFATPVINLFPMTADRIHVKASDTEFHVVADRNRPMDFEIYRVEGVTGFGKNGDDRLAFHPFYHLTHHGNGRIGEGAFFTIQRRLRERSSRQRWQGARSSYLGSECFLSIVDAEHAPFAPQLRQLEVSCLCSNRDLPLQMAVGKGMTDFTLDAGAPVQSIRVIAGPTPPRGAFYAGDNVWRFISQLSLNYLSLVEGQDGAGVTALRELLALYVDGRDALARHVGGVLSVESWPTVRRMPVPGPICFGNGLEIHLKLHEAAFIGTGAFLLGAVLERFFARYVSLNSFTQTIVETDERGEIMRWPVRAGRRQVL
ncbi:MAG: type VI secretion system baseplate subunit TssF [Nitrococcus mobilis]|nr:type VI secretion system baseplate subunit TssF [Nitrococcus mobilis]